MVEYETETLEVEMAQCAGQLFGERITNGIGVTNTFALHDFNCLLANRLHRKRIDSYWYNGSSPVSMQINTAGLIAYCYAPLGKQILDISMA